MNPIPVGQAILHKVVARLGSLHAAALKLGMPPRVIDRFLEGKARVPDRILLHALDVLEESSRKPTKFQNGETP